MSARKDITDSLRNRVYERDGFLCRTCRSNVRTPGQIRQRGHILATVDHIVPVALGGPHTLENFQTLCYPCNMLKGCLTEDEWDNVFTLIRRTREYNDWRKSYYDFYEAKHVGGKRKRMKQKGQRKRSKPKHIPEFYVARKAERAVRAYIVEAALTPAA